MDVHMVAYLFAIAAGIVSSGVIGTLWTIATDEEPGLNALETADLLTPVRALATVFSAPTTLMVNSSYDLFDRPLIGIAIWLLGLILSFFQGVVVLTQVFGVS